METMFAEKLQKLRKENNISQKDLAKQIGYSQPIISQWENKIYEPTASAIRQIAIFFDVSTDYLLGLEDDVGAKTYIRNSFNNFSNNGTIKIK